jgi:D-alanine-D-alanine ligase
MPKLRVAVLFGGRSGEHEVSIRSAASVIAALDRSRYEVVPVAITKSGAWLGAKASANLLPLDECGPLSTEIDPHFSLQPGASSGFDLVFPVLHGTFGEDGTVQGYLELAGLPYVGSGVLGSACGMDKDVMKRLFRERGLPTADHICLLRGDHRDGVEQIEKRFNYPLFVKPANLGSSVGISRAANREALLAALDLAAEFDRKIIVEPEVVGREIECSVLGNDSPEASLPGEIVTQQGFYDYETKYITDDAELAIPADLTREQVGEVQRVAVEAFLAVECCGLARVDLFLKNGSGRLLLNEVNTMPGFTSISMYPKLWEVSGLLYPALLDRLIELAMERREQRRQTRFEL